MKTKERIGIIDMCYGLYILNKHDVKHFNIQFVVSKPICSIKIINIGHYKMGHPFIERLSNMQINRPYIIVDKNYVCHICHQGKQKLYIFFFE